MHLSGCIAGLPERNVRRVTDELPGSAAAPAVALVGGSDPNVEGIAMDRMRGRRRRDKRVLM